MEKLCCTGLGVQKLDNAIHWIISIHRTAQTVSLMRRTHCGGIVIYTVDAWRNSAPTFEQVRPDLSK